MQVTILIPARMAATRFPNKPLASLLGKPMIQWVYERASQARADRVIVATDCEEIASVVRAFGGKVSLTRADHPNGTSRIAEVARGLESEILINVQGDEPTIEPAAIDAVIEPLRRDASLEMSTLAHPIRDFDSIFDPNCVKVVLDAKQHALYFSRAPIPFIKHPEMSSPSWPREIHAEAATHLRHLGIYGYRRDFLMRYVAHAPCPLEDLEGLEQLRALYMGAKIYVGITEHVTIGVDRPQDLINAETYLKGSIR